MHYSCSRVLLRNRMMVWSRGASEAAAYFGGRRQVETSEKRVTRMSGNERLDFKAGPLGNLSQAYFGGLDMMVKGYEPALKGVGRWNLELFGLMARALQAWLEIPSRLSRCKTPVEAGQRAGAVLAGGGGRLRRRLRAAGGGVERMRDDAEAQRRRSPATTSRSRSRRSAAAAPKRSERKAA